MKRLLLPAASPPPLVEPPPDWLEHCPSCGGALDTGWECNECGQDWEWLSKLMRHPRRGRIDSR